MQLIYNLIIFKASIVIKVLALFNSKIRKGVKGRKTSFLTLKNHIKSTDKIIWFHCASLGEYEQGLPVFKKVKKKYPNHKIVLSFFSPSGYEIKKRTPIADLVVYLPLDSKNNAKKFVALLKPQLSIFVKYDIWPNYIQQLELRGLKKILISAALRPHQIYFKWYGTFFTKALTSFNYIFTQNKTTKTLLSTINYNHAIVSGDTRFDRVAQQLKANNTLDFIETFKAFKTTLVFGSTWQEDEALFIDYINNASNKLKFIIAPHEISTITINRLLKRINKKTVLYSKKNKATDLANYNVFIIDTIGLLSKIYNYADIAYIGGGAGNTGLHNILEPATFGIPVLFGKNHKKFPEAKRLIDYGGALEIVSKENFNTTLKLLLIDEAYYNSTCRASKDFISNQTGATNTIIKKILSH